MAAGRRKGKKHLITTRIEHHAVLNSCKSLEKEGYEVTCLGVDEMGMISPAELENAIRPDTALISVMYANNEIGTIEPVEAIGRIAREHHVLFHTDAVQAYGHLPIRVKDAGIDLLSVSAHKLNGPKGVGFLYVAGKVADEVTEEMDLPPLLDGGQQENGKRAGTENVAGIVGLEKAAELAHKGMEERERHIVAMRDHLIRRILTEVPFSRLNGARKQRLSGNCNISFQFIEGASLLVLLDMDGICASAGSTCASSSLAPSHVLKALGIPDEAARGTVRFTIGQQNTMEEMDVVADSIRKNVKKLREESPEYEDYINTCCPKRY
ncbi:MAG: aminotransferase class V-fold PLP-dependent enzyme [Clostridiales bacterium]|nr:aminotransferase class V-fold PLP-dependent enzyme [Clostridiales bacterium]